jgi:putative ABC transport system substrate-binding protein
VKRRELVALLGGAAVWPLSARGQQPTKVAQIGFLGAASRHSALGRRTLDAFRQGLRDLGYIEDRNIAIEERHAELDFDRLRDLAAELVRLDVAVIVAVPTPAAVATRNATGTIPIVMIAVGDPVRQGLVTSLAHPGGNVTGLSFTVSMETFGKGLELLTDAVPGLRHVAVLSNPANPSSALALPTIEAAARPLGVRLEMLEVRSRDAFEGAFAAMAEARVGAVLVVTDAVFIFHAARLAELAARHRLPSMHSLRESVEAGGLMSYGPDLADQARRAAAFVDKILKGAKPADLPIEQPTKFDLVINLSTAKALDLTIPPTLLARADEVIE